MSQCCCLIAIATQLCSPEAVVKTLPTSLHMLLSTLAHISHVPLPPSPQRVPAPAPAPAPTSTSSVLRSLEQLTVSLPLADPDQVTRILDILQAALTSLVSGESLKDRGVSGAKGVADMERAAKLLAVTLLLKASPAVCPPGSPLFPNCVALFRECLKAGDSKVGKPVLDLLKSV